MESTHNTEPNYVSTGVVRMVKDEDAKTNAQGVETWTDFLHLIPHLQQSRDPNSNAAIKRGNNSSVLLLSFIMIDGFLGKLIETVIYKLQIDRQDDEIWQRLLNSHLNNYGWEFDKKIDLINLLLNNDIRQIKGWDKIKVLRNFRNLLGHGGEIVISENELTPEYYFFKRDVCKNMLLQTGILKQHDADKITQEHLNILFSDAVADYYFNSSKDFLKALNALNPNAENREFLAEHYFNF